MTQTNLRGNKVKCYVLFAEVTPDRELEYVARLYRTIDGCPERTGLDLVYCIQQYQVVNELPENPDVAVRYAHGAGDLFAAIIAMLKDPHKSDHVYLEAVNRPLSEVSYVYYVIVEGTKVTLRITKGNESIFEGDPMAMQNALEDGRR